MKYLKAIFTLIFVAAGALIYLGNVEWMNTSAVFSFNSFGLYEIPQVSATNGMALAAAFLLGMIFALIHSSLNWIELMSKNRKIKKLESAAEKTESGGTET